jgi:hypothetical protein
MNIALVLGAGASSDYGYPLGATLREEILNTLARGSDMYVHLEKSDNKPDQIDLFRRSLERSDYDTIDQFLGAHGKHPFLKSIGKQAIVYAIASKENNDLLFRRGGAPHWYKRLVEFLRNHPKLTRRDHLAIFTYNYDRSLEHYLHDAITSGGGGFSANIVSDFFEGNIIHLHGSVGSLPWQVNGRVELPREYGEPLIYGALRPISHGIITPDEDSSISNPSMERLMASDMIAFMGFGFHEQNLRKVQFEQYVQQKGKRVWATTKGLNEKRKNYLTQFANVNVRDADCATFIGEFVEQLEEHVIRVLPPSTER